MRKADRCRLFLYNEFMLILFYILQWLLIVILFAILTLLFVWMWSAIRARVPFVPVPNSILKDIEHALAIKENSVVYDLGCGDGRILFSLARAIPEAKYIGIENSLFPFLLASVRNWWHKKFTKDNVTIIKQDFFKYDISNATHIVTYLYPNVMDELLTPLEAQLKPCTRLVSVTFKFTLKRPIAEIDLERSKYKLARKMYIYEF